MTELLPLSAECLIAFYVVWKASQLPNVPTDDGQMKGARSVIDLLSKSKISVSTFSESQKGVLWFSDSLQTRRPFGSALAFLFFVFCRHHIYVDRDSNCVESTQMLLEKLK